MKKIFFFLHLFIAISSLAFSQPVYTDPKTSIPVSFTTDEEMYPESWRGGSINAEAVALNESEYERSKSIVSRALEKYPVEILKKHIKKIYVLDDIKFYGLRYGGTNSLNAVYISNKGLEKGYTDKYVEQLFHAEFSSILLRNLSYYLNETTWLACNSDSLSYGGSGQEAIRNKKAGEDFDEELNRLGFLNQYATSNFENDVNSFAKNIFIPKTNFWNIVKKYPRLQCKLDLIILFYSQIHASFTEAYFKKLDV
jgi:hypothetical protein